MPRIHKRCLATDGPNERACSQNSQKRHSKSEFWPRNRSTGKKIGDAWGITGNAYVDRTTAVLRYYGLLEYQGVGKERE